MPFTLKRYLLYTCLKNQTTWTTFLNSLYENFKNMCQNEYVSNYKEDFSHFINDVQSLRCMLAKTSFYQIDVPFHQGAR